MLKTFILSIALSAGDLPYEQLEKLYWDCDTMFMLGELGGQDTWSCLAITDEFQSYFADRDAFMQYWEENRRIQWDQRGYAWPANNT